MSDNYNENFELIKLIDKQVSYKIIQNIVPGMSKIVLRPTGSKWCYAFEVDNSIIDDSKHVEVIKYHLVQICLDKIEKVEVIG